MNHMIVDLQFGSTGKGLMAYWLADRWRHTVAICAHTPNAGHTVIIDGVTYVHTALPCAALAESIKFILIGPGAVFDLDQLIREARFAAGRLDGKTIIVHPNAILLRIADKLLEDSTLAIRDIASTAKGTAAANTRRMMRVPDAIINHQKVIVGEAVHALARHGVGLRVSRNDYMEIIADPRNRCIIEGCQGFGLSIYHGMYPYTTSRDTTPNQLAADCALLSTWRQSTTVVGTMRTYPIRVGHTYDDAGVQIGNSGPWHDDQQELTWASIGIEPELTTVTHRVRRVATFSQRQLTEACQVVAPDELFINFCNYATTSYIDDIQAHLDRMGYDLPDYYGYGPRPLDVSTFRHYDCERQ